MNIKKNNVLVFLDQEGYIEGVKKFLRKRDKELERKMLTEYVEDNGGSGH